MKTSIAKKLVKTVALTLFLMFPISMFANKTSVTVDSPATCKKGESVTITIHVSHKGNSGMHHTDWVYVKVNGAEVKRWTFDKKALPEKEEFVLTLPITVDANSTITIEGNCNLHGSTGIVTKEIKVE